MILQSFLEDDHFGFFEVHRTNSSYQFSVHDGFVTKMGKSCSYSLCYSCWSLLPFPLSFPDIPSLLAQETAADSADWYSLFLQHEGPLKYNFWRSSVLPCLYSLKSSPHHKPTPDLHLVKSKCYLVPPIDECDRFANARLIGQLAKLAN